MALAFCLLAVTASAAWAETCENCETKGLTKEDGTGIYLIKSAADLAILLDCVNLGDPDATPAVEPNPHNNVEFKLTTSINLKDLGETPWEPIGSYVSEEADRRPFNGKFDGANPDGGRYTISGLDVSNNLPGTPTTNNRSLGLFGYVGPNGVVQNLNVQGTVSRTGLTGIQNDDTGIGGVVGHNGGRVEGCSFSGVDSAVTGPSSVGGVVGANIGANAKVINCFNTGRVTGAGSTSSYAGAIGGVVGLNSETGATVTKCYNTGPVTNDTNNTGGVVGRNFNSAAVSECYNIGLVRGLQFVGGVVGINSTTNSEVKNCYNIGNVTGLVYDDDDNKPKPDGGSPARGGVVGGNTGKVEYSYSYCTITGVYNVGGIVGLNYTSSGSSGTVQNCVSLTWRIHGAGALVGGPNYPTIKPNANSNDDGSDDNNVNVGRVVGRNSSNASEPLKGNKAREDMEVLIEGVDVALKLKSVDIGLEKRHGEGVLAEGPNAPHQSVVFAYDNGSKEGWDPEIWDVPNEYLRPGRPLPTLLNVDGPQIPKLPDHPHSPGSTDDDDGGCGCDAGGFTAPGLLALAFMMGIKRLRRR